MLDRIELIRELQKKILNCERNIYQINNMTAKEMTIDLFIDIQRDKAVIRTLERLISDLENGEYDI